MLESIFIMLMSMGFVLFILAIYEKSVVFSATSILMWIMCLAGIAYIEVPAADTTYSEFGMIGVTIAFIFSNVIWLIVQFMDFQKSKSALP